MAALVKSAELRLFASDGDVQEKLDAIAVKVDELKADNPELVARIDTAAASAKLQVLRDELKEVGAQAGETGGEMDAAGTQMATAGGKGEESGAKLEGAWKFTKLALLGVGGALGYGIVKAAGFQSQMTMLHTQAGVATDQLKGLGAGVLQLAGQVGESPDSLAESLYHVESNFASLGISAPKALSLVKVAAEGARTGGANLVDVTNALTAAVASGIPGVQNISGAMGTLNSIVGAGDMKMQDLAEAFGTGMVAVVKGYGLSITDVGAALDVFGDNNIRGAHAGTQLRMSVQALAVPAAAGAAELKKLGLNSMSLADAMQHGGLLPALELLQKKFKENGITAAEQGNVITTIFGKKAGVGVAVLMDQMDRLKSKYPALAKGADDFGKAWGDTQKTAGQQLKNLEMGSEALATSLGLKLLPAATKVMKWLSGFVNGLEKGSAGATAIAAVIGTVLAGIALEKLSSGLKGAVEGFEGLAKGGMAAVKFLASGSVTLFNGIKSGISSAASGIGSLIGKFTGAAAAEDELTVATEAEAGAQEEADAAMDANPIGAIIIGITLLAAGIYEVVKHWKDFKQWGMDAFHFVEHAAEDVWNWIKGHWPLLLGILTGPIGLAVEQIITHWKDITKFFSDMWHDVTKIAESLWHDVTGFFKDMWHDVTGIASDLWNDLVSGAEMLWNDLTGLVKDLWNREVQGWTNIWHGVVAVAENLWNDLVRGFERLPGDIMHALGDLGSLLISAGESIINGLIHGIESAVGGLLNIVKGIGSDISGAFKSVLSILSPSKVFEEHGRNIIRGLVNGINGEGPSAMAAIARVAGSLSMGGGGGGGYGAAGGGTLRLEWYNSGGADQEFLTWLSNHIRTAGGSPDIIRRKVVFA